MVKSMLPVSNTLASVCAHLSVRQIRGATLVEGLCDRRKFRPWLDAEQYAKEGNIDAWRAPRTVRRKDMLAICGSRD
eukprot:4952187-Pleurochrysis_carterae.AAC.1